MKLLLISIIIFLFLSLFYLAYFIALKIKATEKKESNKVIRFIKHKFFPTISCVTILFFSYIY